MNDYATGTRKESTSIQLQFDYPSCHRDGRLSLLDLKVWVERRMAEDEGGACVLLHECCFKEINQCKVNPLVEFQEDNFDTESLRILLNCRRELPWATVVRHVNHMMLHLQYSGYNQ